MQEVCACYVMQCLCIQHWAKHAIDGLMPGQALLCLTSLCSVIPAHLESSQVRASMRFLPESRAAAKWRVCRAFNSD